MRHRHDWQEAARFSTSIRYECPCGATKLVTVKEAKGA